MPIEIIKTKLHRPPIARDHLHRLRLISRLEKGIKRPLTLISAPAGYGKTTLASCWMETCDYPNAWVALEPNDSELRIFLTYLTTAIYSIFPGALPKIRVLLKAAGSLEVPSLTTSFINELDKIDKRFLVVMDDYQAIRGKSVHDFVNNLLKHSPELMHLVIISRRDPPLPIVNLRAAQKITEIRLQDLRLSSSESAKFFQQIMNLEVDNQTVAAISDKAEGWVAGLRLAALSFRDSGSIRKQLAELPSNNRYVMDYLISEVVANQPHEIKDYLLSAAILHRFSASLCEAVCIGQNDSKTCTLSGSDFIDHVDRNNMFAIPLDDQQEWYRFHHLFRGLLKNELERLMPPERIKELYKRAGQWFAHNELSDEALEYLLMAGDIRSARELVVTERYNLTKNERWYQLDKWIAALPEHLFKKDPELLMIKAWVLENQERIQELRQTISQIEEILDESKLAEPGKSFVIGELNVLKAMFSYMKGDVERANTYSNHALELVPFDHPSERAFALLISAFTHQMSRDSGRARKKILGAMECGKNIVDTYTGRLILSLCFVDWLDGDLANFQLNAEQLLKFSEAHDLVESKAFANYHLGMAAYYRGDTETTQRYLKSAVELGQLVDLNTYYHGSYALALSYQAGGQPEKAMEIAVNLVSESVKHTHTWFYETSKAFHAELWLRQGCLYDAEKWSENYQTDLPKQAMRFFSPDVTLVKILIAQNTGQSRQRANEMLDRLIGFYASINNKHMLIELYAVKALLSDVEGDQSAAVSNLKEALTRARLSRRIQPFLGLGQNMAELLKLVHEEGAFKGYVTELLSSFDKTERIAQKTRPESIPSLRPQSRNSLEHPENRLSNREIDIVQHMSQRMTNKEIAEKLFISPETVKRHTANIYSKLDTHNRQDAVAKARDLGLC